MKLEAIEKIISNAAASSQIDVKSYDLSRGRQPGSSSHQTMRAQGIDRESQRIVKAIEDNKLKVQPPDRGGRHGARVNGKEDRRPAGRHRPLQGAGLRRAPCGMRGRAESPGSGWR